jgi:hypothetical protein
MRTKTAQLDLRTAILMAAAVASAIIIIAIRSIPA